MRGWEFVPGRVFNLLDCAVTPEFIAASLANTQLVSLYMYSLTGLENTPLPDRLTSLAALTLLVANSNGLAGTIPDGLSAITGLVYVPTAHRALVDA